MKCMKIVKLLIFNVERWTNKGPKKALLCLVTNYSLIVWSERVTELKVMKGTFQTEIAFSCVSKMKVVVTSLYYVLLILSNICFVLFHGKGISRTYLGKQWPGKCRHKTGKYSEINIQMRKKEEINIQMRKCGLSKYVFCLKCHIILWHPAVMESFNWCLDK